MFVAFTPERIDPGNTVNRQEDVPRVVGGATEDCTERAADVVARIAGHAHRVSSPEAAELCKLYENSFRAVNIGFANEMADASRRLGLDPVEVLEAAATKPYGFMAFHPGAGVGGHCIPCDPHYLLENLRGASADAPILARAMQAIAARPHRVVERACELLTGAGASVSGARVLVVGASYKPGMMDTRESPALEIIRELRARAPRSHSTTRWCGRSRSRAGRADAVGRAADPGRLRPGGRRDGPPRLRLRVAAASARTSSTAPTGPAGGMHAERHLMASFAAGARLDAQAQSQVGLQLRSAGDLRSLPRR